MNVGRGGASCSFVYNEVVMAGGFNESSVEIYSLVTGEWRMAPALPHQVYMGSAVKVR